MQETDITTIYFQPPLIYDIPRNAHYKFNVQFCLLQELYRNVCMINSTTVKACYMHKTKQILSLTLEYGTDKLSRNVGNYHYSLRNTPKERMSHLPSGGSLKSRISM